MSGFFVDIYLRTVNYGAVADAAANAAHADRTGKSGQSET